MHELLALAERRGFGVFFLGARQDALEKAVANLNAQHPDLKVSGYRNGYFADDEGRRIAEEIRATGPTLLFVAMSSPKKERWLSEHGTATGVRFAMGVGGAIDVVAGVTRRAPRWMQVIGMEWLYRMLQEPRRLVGRYARTNGTFVLLVAREALRLRTPAFLGTGRRSSG
jgi:N-acetylglucosaminyldiphosphoundecaprenol N-acetyl-beta-D-mannosaminyltransferase